MANATTLRFDEDQEWLVSEAVKNLTEAEKSIRLGRHKEAMKYCSNAGLCHRQLKRLMRKRRGAPREQGERTNRAIGTLWTLLVLWSCLTTKGQSDGLRYTYRHVLKKQETMKALATPQNSSESSRQVEVKLASLFDEISPLLDAALAR